VTRKTKVGISAVCAVLLVGAAGVYVATREPRPKHTPRAVTRAQLQAMSPEDFGTTKLCGNLSVVDLINKIDDRLENEFHEDPKALSPEDSKALFASVTDTLLCVAYPDELGCVSRQMNDHDFLFRGCRRVWKEAGGREKLGREYCGMINSAIGDACDEDQGYVNHCSSRTKC
jgi:hypothetical protein